MQVETSKTLAPLYLGSSLRSVVSELSEQGTKTVILHMLKMHKGQGENRTKQQKLVMRMFSE